MDGGHVHTGFAAFVFAGVSAIVFIQITRLIAAQLADNSSTSGIGKALGGLVTFGG